MQSLRYSNLSKKKRPKLIFRTIGHPQKVNLLTAKYWELLIGTFVDLGAITLLMCDWRIVEYPIDSRYLFKYLHIAFKRTPFFMRFAVVYIPLTIFELFILNPLLNNLIGVVISFGRFLVALTNLVWVYFFDSLIGKFGHWNTYCLRSARFTHEQRLWRMSLGQFFNYFPLVRTLIKQTSRVIRMLLLSITVHFYKIESKINTNQSKKS